MFIVFLLCICVHGTARFCCFSYIINVCCDFFNEVMQTYHTQLSTCADFKFADVFHILNVMIDIIMHVIYVSIVWPCLISKFLLNLFEVINAVVPLADLM